MFDYIIKLKEANDDENDEFIKIKLYKYNLICNMFLILFLPIWYDISAFNC